MPIVAMVAVVVLLGALLWFLHRTEDEEEQLSVIKDILWLEQNIHFHLTTDEEKLTQLAEELARGQPDYAAFDREAKAVMQNNPELERLTILDTDGHAVLSVPPSQAARPTGADQPWREGFVMARSLGRAAWTGPIYNPGRGWGVEVHVPIHQNQDFRGMLVGTVSVDALLTHHVPWWVAEKYRIEIVDGDGAVLGAKSQMALAADPDPDSGSSHQVRLEPPGRGISMISTAYGRPGNLTRNMLAAAIVAMALLAVFSLWLVRRHVRRRLLAEQALREEHAFRKAMEDSLTVGMRARDLDGRVTYVNPAFCRMVGWTAEDLVGTAPPMPYWAPDALDSTMEMHQQVMAGNAPQDGFEIRFRRRCGDVFWALVYEAPLIDADGRQSGWMASVLDITERKQAEELARLQQENLQRTGRLVTMGEMASTLAHELNQPLSAIASYNTGCLNKLDRDDFDPAEVRAALGKLGRQAQRAGHIIRRVHDFVRKSEPRLGPCALNRVVEDSVGFIEFDARRRGVGVLTQFSPLAPVVLADRILMEQVVLNLIRNGLEAMGQSPSPGRLVVGVAVEDGRAVVSVSDSGPGLPDDIAKALFDPFFTTKEEGMGMGLNICRTIIEFHHGRLWFDARGPDGGAVFWFSLPLAGAEGGTGQEKGA